VNIKSDEIIMKLKKILEIDTKDKD